MAKNLNDNEKKWLTVCARVLTDFEILALEREQKRQLLLKAVLRVIECIDDNRPILPIAQDCLFPWTDEGEAAFAEDAQEGQA